MKSDRSLRRCRGVAILVPNIDIAGGMERQASRLAERLVADGRRVVIISTYSPRGTLLRRAAGDPPRFERRRGVLIYRVPFFAWVENGASWALYRMCAAWIIRRHATWARTIYAVQAQSGGLHAAKISRAVPRPTVVKLACSGSVGDIEVTRRAQDGVEVLECLRTVDRVVCLNDQSWQEALGVGVDPARLVKIPNGIDLASASCVLPADVVEFGFPRDSDLVLFVGRLEHQKRVHILLDAFARLGVHRPNARLLIVGDGPERGRLEALARALDVSERVRFAGIRNDVPRLMRRASAFVLPSAEEGLSNALLEALAARTAAIVSDIPGNREVVQHEREALFFAVDDVRALEEALERILTDRSLAERLSLAGYERLASQFDIRRVVELYLALFDSLPRPLGGLPLGGFVHFEIAQVDTLVSWIAAVAIAPLLARVRAWITYCVLRAKRLFRIQGDLIARANRGNGDKAKQDRG